MTEEEKKDFMEDVERYVKHIAAKYAEGTADRVDDGERMTVKEEYLEEGICIDLEIPTIADLPDFSTGIARAAVKEVAKILEDKGYELEWTWEYEFDVLPKHVEEE